MKLLVIRMSSLGDLILSLAFLENLPEGTTVDWIVSSSFAFALKDHPRIRKLMVFDKKSGLSGWLKLLKSTLSESYDARVDLHVTTRSRLARQYFFMQDLLRMKFIPWTSISKERFRTFALLGLKKLCPTALLPTPMWKRFASLGANFRESPGPELAPPVFTQVRSSENYGLKEKAYYCVAPASRWKTKEWDPKHYALLVYHLVKEGKAEVIILGRLNDPACIKVIELLTIYKTPFRHALREEDFGVTADLIKNSIAYIGGDTGLAHLAEAVGTPAVMIFGPTRPTLGFGPWRKNSVSIFSDVFCSPCSKDGKLCYRVTDPYACLKRISVDQVLQKVLQVSQAVKQGPAR